MEKEGALLLILADKLNSYDEAEIRRICSDMLGLPDTSDQDTVCRILLRWIQLDSHTRQKILAQVSHSAATGQETELSLRINMAIQQLICRRMEREDRPTAA
ncbi:MAG: hypothetical protein JST76_14590 [Bacteroidetes bacterium]|nr:hypothetical protein [Bacteroidota bacterium]